MAHYRGGSSCRHLIDHPSLSRRLPDEQIVGLLRRRAVARDEMIRPDATLGAKHPMLSTMGPDTLAAWPGCRYVVVDRPAGDVIDSIVRTNWGWSRPEAEHGATALTDWLFVRPLSEPMAGCGASSRRPRVSLQESARQLTAGSPRPYPDPPRRSAASGPAADGRPRDCDLIRAATRTHGRTPKRAVL